MLEVIDVTGEGKGTVFLIKGKTNILYEAGMAFCADRMIEQIKTALQGESLHGVLISHSHYDHVAGLPYIRKEWPDVTVYGSQRAKEILEKASALSTIRELSMAAATAADCDWNGQYEDKDLQIDVAVADQEEFSVGEHKILAVETIGHTKCCLTYLVDGEVLFCSETIGVMTPKRQYIPAFLVDYKMMMESIERCRKLKAPRVVISHYGFVADGEVFGIWDLLEDMAVESKEKMMEIIKNNPEDQQLKKMQETFHKGISKKDQPDEAFLINAASMLHTLKRQFSEEVSR